jgi:Fe-S-cluster containining protein
VIPFGVAVERLIEELAADLEGYARNRRFPRKVPLQEAEQIAAFLQEQVDMGVDARARAIARSDVALACTRGCNGCCEEPIMVFRPESARVAHWLARPENAGAKEAFLAAYPAWSARIGTHVEELSALFETDPSNYVGHHVDVWRKGVVCVFNRDGDCTVYPVRPIVCRTAHALETNEHCKGSSETPATHATFVPLDEFVARARALLRATHNATHGTRGRPTALPHAVYAMLTNSAG